MCRRSVQVLNYRKAQENKLSRRHVEFIKHAKCHVGTFFISKIPQLSNKTDTDWPFRFIAQGLDVRRAI